MFSFLVVDGSYAKLIPKKGPDYSEAEANERTDMAAEEADMLSMILLRKCVFCSKSFDLLENMHAHVATTHNIPLKCPFQRCQQPVSTENALRYHIWNCTTTKMSRNDHLNTYLSSVFELSSNYCKLKKRRHYLPNESHLSDMGEDNYLEDKLQVALSEWKLRGGEHNQLFKKRAETLLYRENVLQYQSPSAVYSIDFNDEAVAVAEIESIQQQLVEAGEQKRVESSIIEMKVTTMQNEREAKEAYIVSKSEQFLTATKKWMKQSLKRDKNKAVEQLKELDETFKLEEKKYLEFTIAIENTIAKLGRLLSVYSRFLVKLQQVLSLRNALDKIKTMSNTRLAASFHLIEKRKTDLIDALSENTECTDTLQDFERDKKHRARALRQLQEKLRSMQLHHSSERYYHLVAREHGEEEYQLKMLRGKQREVELRRLLARHQGHDDNLFQPPLAPLQTLAITNLDQVLHGQFVDGLDQRESENVANHLLDELEHEDNDEHKKQMSESQIKSYLLLEQDPTKMVRLEGNFEKGTISGHVRISLLEAFTFYTCFY